MNKVKWLETGGAPIRNDDWEFEAAAVREAIAGMAKVYGDSYIVSGFNVSGLGTTSTTWTAGVVVLNGEVYRVNASASPIDTQANTHWYIEPEVTSDPAGDVVMESGVAKNIYDIRTAKLTAYSTPQTGKQPLLTTKRVKTIINELTIDEVHSYTKRQSFPQGNDASATPGSEVIDLSDYTSGNAYNLNITTADVPLTRFSAPMPDGTYMVIRFTGTGTVIIADGTSFNNGIDTGGRAYPFNVGELAFFVWMDSKARLINRGNYQWVEANPIVDSMSSIITGITDVSFRWNINGSMVHCRYFYNINVSGAGIIVIIYSMPLGIVAKPPQSESALVASLPGGEYPHIGSCRIGNGANYSKMVHTINDVPTAGIVQAKGSAFFEI